ncbi:MULTISPECIES: tRNA (adenosine(37)-N6)-threonylcarbamoyltransferase complex dimerization subunit type 1 TsaB [Micromonospora]|uniref:tRNA (adenosine(37)-N6)-threonylcarbamoyltransferase complex dimerization subunit type 1 TsaB n=1 Tax=Micromonospora TaxID=1873 RepID=UPI0008201D41|nr:MULTISPECIES: tRNA (adenosine(37)-N6)-threonylcarbamoyltransferase complex dimerization subunit type 1 TsaB [Micromonospora]MBQ0982641.1 tRNA (adenosine(37)-N6)-threonylcarbamoyltransferase complex dimerization subunit type 1 TsaB [Micromonospora sp. M61]MBQ1040426.1 tRNA (adenosine(37)-N6)-threonylcarbamoyltransferase complex dimerization subunit type 1 TsaB [Micromonospora sp. C81]TQJ25101.1 tRNA threonylcarbamoyl adenosine modification protein YeaZ [Micromonospora sp. A202]WTE86317.1 tRNA
MLVLVVDSSTPAVTAALVEVSADGVVSRAHRCTVDARAHGELLAPQVDAVLADADARPRDLSAIVAGLGPGPFTGLRVGLVTAATMGQVLGIPTYGVCSLDAIGYPAASGEPVLAASDARRKELYWAVYDGAGQRIVGPEVSTPSVAAARARELGATIAVGDGAHRYAEILDLPVRVEPRYPDATVLALLAAERIRAGASSERLTPLYLRRPDAVAAVGRKPVLP